MLLSELYWKLIDTASAHFPTEVRPIETRMSKYVEDRAYITAPIVKGDVHVSLAAILRAGVIPTQTAAELISLMPGITVYEDWITAERQTNSKGEIIGTEISGKKITTPKDLPKSSHKILILADPMGATSSTDDEAIGIYNGEFAKEGGIGYFNQVFALHLIITPEYVKRMTSKHPDVKILALRCDRGLSYPDVLETKLGTYPEREKGLTEKRYIAPGGGDIGKLLSELEGPRL